MDRGTGRLGMTLAVDWDVKPETIQNNYRIIPGMLDHTHTRTHEFASNETKERYFIFYKQSKLF